MEARRFEARFYGQLGFVEDGRWADYLSLVHPIGIELHFNLAGRQSHPGSASVRFATAAQAQELYRIWLGLAPPGRLSELHATHFGHLEFDLTDPFGNVIRIGGVIYPEAA
jgi:hypothetical protein